MAVYELPALVVVAEVEGLVPKAPGEVVEVEGELSVDYKVVAL